MWGRRTRKHSCYASIDNKVTRSNVLLHKLTNPCVYYTEEATHLRDWSLNISAPHYATQINAVALHTCKGRTEFTWWESQVILHDRTLILLHCPSAVNSCTVSTWFHSMPNGQVRAPGSYNKRDGDGCGAAVWCLRCCARAGTQLTLSDPNTQPQSPLQKTRVKSSGTLPMSQAVIPTPRYGLCVFLLTIHSCGLATDEWLKRNKN